MNKQATGTTYPILPLALVDCMSVIPCFNKPGSPSSTAEHVLFMQFTWVIHKLPNTSQSCFETMNILHPVAATPWSIELWDGRKACFKGNFVMALQACLSLFCIGEGRERKKVYPVRASTPTQQAAMHARSTPCFPSLPPSLAQPTHLHHKRRGIIPPLSVAVASYSPERGTGWRQKELPCFLANIFDHTEMPCKNGKW